MQGYQEGGLASASHISVALSPIQLPKTNSPPELLLGLTEVFL